MWSGKSLTGFGADVEKQLEDRQREIVIEGLRMVQMGSPVDEGSFRSNHRVSLESPDGGFDPDAQTSSAPKGNIDQSAFDSQIRKLVGGVPFTKAFIENNAPYGPRLEAGSSEQAPEGVYALAFNNLRERYGG